MALEMMFNATTLEDYHFLRDACFIKTISMEQKQKNIFHIYVEFQDNMNLHPLDTNMELKGGSEGIMFQLINEELPYHIQNIYQTLSLDQSIALLPYLLKTPFLFPTTTILKEDIIFVEYGLFRHKKGYIICSDGTELTSSCVYDYTPYMELDEIRRRFSENINNIAEVSIGLLSVKRGYLVNHEAPIQPKRLCAVKDEKNSWCKVTYRNRQFKGLLEREREKETRETFLHFTRPKGEYVLGQVYNKSELPGNLARVLALNDKCILWQCDIYNKRLDMLDMKDYAYTKSAFVLEYYFEGKLSTENYQGVYKELIEHPGALQKIDLVYHKNVNILYVDGDITTSHPIQYEIVNCTRYYIEDIDVWKFDLKDNIQFREHKEIFAAYYQERIFILAPLDPLIKQMQKQDSLVKHLVV